MINKNYQTKENNVAIEVVVKKAGTTIKLSQVLSLLATTGKGQGFVIGEAPGVGFGGFLSACHDQSDVGHASWADELIWWVLENEK